MAEYAVQPSEKLDPKIERSLSAADLFILIWSGEATSSAYVGAELGFAKSQGKTILPVFLEEGFRLPPSSRNSSTYRHGRAGRTLLAGSVSSSQILLTESR